VKQGGKQQPHACIAAAKYRWGIKGSGERPQDKVSERNAICERGIQKNVQYKTGHKKTMPANQVRHPPSTAGDTDAPLKSKVGIAYRCLITLSYI
jgi:hypothetical protein